MTPSEFIQARASETYPEPITQGHEDIINLQAGPLVATMLEPGARILDVGCGSGPALRFFEGRGFKIEGITLNEEDLRACVADGFTVSKADMHDLSMGDSIFDCVFARHVIEHSVIPFYVLAEFHRILKPGGVLYLETPAPFTPCFHEQNLNHYSVMGARMWMNLIDRCGFEKIEARELQLETPLGPDKYTVITAKKKQ